MKRTEKATNNRKVAATPAQFEFDVPHVGAVGIGDLNVGHDVPAWMQDWAVWLKQLLVPEWAIRLRLADHPDPHNPNVHALTSTSPEYLDALITVERYAEDNTEGHLMLAHEFAHLLVAPLDSAANVIGQTADAALKSLRGIHYIEGDETYETQTRVALKIHDDAEEQTVVKLSRILVGLRYAILDAEARVLEAELEGKMKLKKLRARTRKTR